MERGGAKMTCRRTSVAAKRTIRPRQPLLRPPLRSGRARCMSKKIIQPCNFLTAKYGTEGSRMARATANQATGDGNSATPTAPDAPTSPATPRPLDVALPVRWRSLCVLPPCRIVGPIPWRARSQRSGVPAHIDVVRA